MRLASISFNSNSVNIIVSTWSNFYQTALEDIVMVKLIATQCNWWSILLLNQWSLTPVVTQLVPTYH